jgi:mxaJ protein
MFSRSLRKAVALAFLLLLAGEARAKRGELKVCADPDNLPFSNQHGQGFENKLAEMLAREMKVKLTYRWSRMGRGFVRNVLNAGECDLLPGIPREFRPVLTTPSYYESAYVFVTRSDRGLQLYSFDDEALKTLQIGVQVLDDDYAPPARALARRGIITNVVGFDTTGQRAKNMFAALERGEIDVAIVWGPLAGYFARRSRRPLTITPVAPLLDPPGLPFAYEISMGVRRSDKQLNAQVSRILATKRKEVQRILKSYGVPLLPTSQKEAD